MKTKTQIPLIVLLALVAGCATTDPVVHAESTIDVATTTFDQFLKWERANQAILPAGVHTYAEFMRVKVTDASTGKVHARAQQWLIDASQTTEAYKRARTTDGKANMGTAILTLETAISKINNYMPKQ